MSNDHVPKLRCCCTPSWPNTIAKISAPESTHHAAGWTSRRRRLIESNQSPGESVAGSGAAGSSAMSVRSGSSPGTTTSIVSTGFETTDASSGRPAMSQCLSQRNVRGPCQRAMSEWRSNVGGDRRQHAVHEPPRIVGRVTLGELDCLVEHDRGRHVRPLDQLEYREAHHAQ